jgi:drug/metabolite transporter (DMT)-like permease
MPWNAAKTHLALCHLPIVAIALGVLFLLAMEITKKEWVGKAGALLLVIAALGAGATYWTGDAAENVLYEYSNATDEAGDASDHVPVHEQRAAWALGTTIVAGLGGAYFLFAGRKAGQRPPAPIRAIVFVVAAMAAAATLTTASAGGEIRHAEIRPDAPSGPEAAPAASEPGPR